VSHQANAKIRAGGTEPELVTRARAGDRTAFAALYIEHRDEVFGFLCNRTRDRHLAEDLTQEAFLRAMNRIDTFKWQGAAFGAWLMVIARNIYLDHVKLARTRLEVTVGEMADSDERDRSAEVSALRDLDIAEATDTIAMAMQVLTPYQRQCVELRFLEDLSVPETAARLGKGIGATKTLQFRALRLMQNALQSEGAAA